MKITNLLSGGIITNYYCSSKCKHCLYNCSQNWSPNYIDSKTTENIMTTLKNLNCNMVHIGGGEPFLNKEKLLDIVKIAKNLNMDLEYVETNSSWYDEKTTPSFLDKLKENGLNKILISISPFHNEYIPFYKVKSLINACKNSEIEVFPWVYDFFDDINYFDDTKPHSLQEYFDKYGNDYLEKIPSRYWIAMRSRAATTFSNVFPLKDTDEILDENVGCNELLDTSHFHIDLDGNYVPGLCSGLAIDYADLEKELDKDKYPILNILFSDGIKGLTEFVTEKYNFKLKEKYLNKCHLCYDLRKELIKKGFQSNDLKPLEHYND
ncbi:MAG: radical SAM protein [Clostridiales bacterium]